jgi:hypothetical protein
VQHPPLKFRILVVLVSLYRIRVVGQITYLNLTFSQRLWQPEPPRHTSCLDLSFLAVNADDPVVLDMEEHIPSENDDDDFQDFIESVLGPVSTYIRVPQIEVTLPLSN